MKDWLRFFFGGFFTNKRLSEAPERSVWNTVLSLFLAFFLVWGGLSLGYAASFGRHYAAAEDFRAFLCASLGKDNPYGVSLRIDGGKLSAQYDGERNCINTFDSPDAGYRLVVDTRPKETTYDDFTVVCRDPDGQTVSYDAYKAMDDAQRKRYECRMEYSGAALDVSRGIADYEAYLGAVCDVNAAQYDREIAEKYAALQRNKGDSEESRRNFENGVYELYFAAKYPDFVGKDAYGAAPTLRTYYMELENRAPDRRYVLLFDDIAMCAFGTDTGVSVDFAGYVSKLDDGAVTTREMTAEQTEENLDAMIRALFRSGSALASFVFLFSLMQMVPFYLLAVLLLTILVWIACKTGHASDCTGFFGAFKAVGATLTMSAVATALNAVILSFVMSRWTVFRVAMILFPVIVTVRLIVFVIACIRAAGERKNDATPDPPADM